MKASTLCVFALALASTALAQVAEFSLSGGQSRLTNNGIGSLTADASARSDDVQLTDGFRFGFRMTLNNWRFFGHEVGYAYNRTQFRMNTQPAQDYGTAIHQGFYDFLVYGTPEGSRVRPFAAGGGHFSNYVFPGQSVTQGGGSTKFGFNYGGGVKVKAGSKFILRLDFRQYQNGKPFDLPAQSGLIRMNEISAGFGIGL
ncbi:MAG: outer membrane beta-barrel protein [Acidobacteria bacterium]|nr:outer membrane beta-barrel protein [Acidobacteriota bacterium]